VTAFSHRTGLQLRSQITAGGQLRLSLVSVTLPAPAADEVIVRVEAAPINPSDIGPMFGAADLSTLQATILAGQLSVCADVPQRAMKAMAARLDRSLTVGLEGAGTVIEAGDSPEAQALLGRRVALFGEAMYAQVVKARVGSCLPLPAGTSAADGASCFVNPLTALGMTETMRLEGHHALVHTAAASNLGQMLVRLCTKDGIPLVNIVRSPQQVQQLRDLGAVWVLDSTAPNFIEQLTDALAATGATLAFDAIGGGRMATQILSCMESALLRTGKSAGRYGTTTHKQVYVYGMLDTGPTEVVRNFGMAWGMGGWLLFPFLGRVGPTRTLALKQRVLDELHTTFASRYSKTVSLTGILDPAEIAVFAKRATGQKYLVEPNR
jgi:NADPH:quinone reductase-like Zn-dependent oxidoreductase